ncbi:MAG: XdhC family protein, partial [Nitriliruptoraceae bacterium]
MRDVLEALATWAGADGIGLATVIDTSQSAPRRPGASLAVHPDGRVIGSVSGGCVEGAVVEIAQQVMAGAAPSRTRFGITDEQAMGVGLTCGGEIEVFVDVLSAGDLERILRARQLVADDEPVAVATVVDGPALHGARIVVTGHDTDGTLGNEGLDVAVVDDARGMLAQATTGLRHYGATGQRRLDDVTVFVDVHAPRPRMYVFGAIDFAAAVARIGRFLDFHVTVCDARKVFATRERFPVADDVVAEWPHRFLARAPVDRRTVICVLTHDPKFDVPVLEVALR